MNINSQVIHIYSYYLFENEFNPTRYLRILSNEELNEVNRLKFDKDKKVKVISRFLLRYLLSKYLRQKPEDLTFVKNSFGKISLSNSYLSKIKFNYSHSNGIILYSFALNDDIGIDIEKINLKIEFKELAIIYFSKKEIEFMGEATSQNAVVRNFYRIWTRKEALLKALGTGLINDLNFLDVIKDEVTISNLNNINLAQNRFIIQDIDVNPDYKSALAYSGPKREIIIKHLKERDIFI